MSAEKDGRPIVFASDEIVTVMMLGAHANAYQRWLEAGGLRLGPIPDSHVYFVAVTDWAWDQVMDPGDEGSGPAFPPEDAGPDRS